MSIVRESNHDFNILLHTQSIVCATADSQCLEYLGYITLVGTQRCCKKTKTRHQKSEHICMYLFSGWIINKDQGGSKILHPSLSRVTDPWIYFLCAHCIVTITVGLIVQRKNNINCKKIIARACSHKQFSKHSFAYVFFWDFEKTISPLYT